MQKVLLRQRRGLMSRPAAGAFDEDLAGAVDDDLGQALVRKIGGQRLEIALEHKAGAAALADSCGCHGLVTNAGAAAPGVGRSNG